MNDDRFDGVILNAYPDSLSGNMEGLLKFLSDSRMQGCFSTLYLLPSIYHYDLDRGFSVIDYDLNQKYIGENDLHRIRESGITLMLDIVMNHASIASPQFQDVLKNGCESKYKDFFIDWNQFWSGYGTMTEDGYIMPEKKYLTPMFFRKPGLPLLMIQMPDGKKIPFWNTFYQKTEYQRPTPETIARLTDSSTIDSKKISARICDALDNSIPIQSIDLPLADDDRQRIIDYLERTCSYSGQMDLNIKSKSVWDFYDETLSKLSEYGASIIRLDAFAYASKVPGKRNFLNEPETWEILSKFQKLADKYDLSLLPEIHEAYDKGIYKKISNNGYPVYDFFSPGLIIYTLEKKNGNRLKRWVDEIEKAQIRTVNMLGCHDGIPLLDLKGMLSDNEIDELINTIVDRGGYIKNLHGDKKTYYQVNATYYSALGCNDKKMIAARALQLFLPGTPLIWYMDLFAGANDYAGMKMAGRDGHKEINRKNYSRSDIDDAMNRGVMKEQIEMIKLRNNSPAFMTGRTMSFSVHDDSQIQIQYHNHGHMAALFLDLNTLDVRIDSE